MKKLIVVAALALSNFMQAQTAPVLVEEVTQKAGELVISYKRYTLPNGLNIIVHEDHSDPIVYVDVTYHVGSAREQQGRSGFAHFFEHMMFQGSKHVADDQHFKIVTEVGGTMNGTTNSDRTNYFETVPSNQLEKMLWLEADRMGFLLDSVTQQKFEVQRATVKNERGQRYDNAPYGLVFEKIGEALYPQAHPYSWTTIGYIEDLNRVDVNDLKRFYMRWYGAGNAVLTVAGDVNTDEVIKLAQKYFGSIPRGVEVKAQNPMPGVLTENRYISYEDNVKFPRLDIVFPTVPANTKDDAALNVLAQILSGSQGSPFYKAFVESKKAVSADVFEYPRELAGQFQIMIRANATSNLADIEKQVKETLTAWEEAGGVTDDDLAKYRAQYLSRTYNALTTVQGKGGRLAHYFTLVNNANYLQAQMQMYLNIGKEDVMNAYNKYIKNKPAVILSCVPKGKSDLKAREDTWKMYERKIESESAEYKNLSYKEPKDNFNRAEMPKAAQAKPVPVPDFYTTKVGTIPLIGVTDYEIPMVNILISVKSGHRFEPAEKSGLAQLLASMLQKSTTQTSAEEIENKLDRLGSRFTIYAGDEELSFSIQSTKQNVKATLDIVQECMFSPKFDAAEFELEKKQQLDGIAQAQTRAASVADMVYRKVLYGKEDVMGFPASGTEETVNAITLEDVKNYYKYLNVKDASIAISGNAGMDEISNQLSFLSKWNISYMPKKAETVIPAIEKTKIYFVDKKGAAQSEIRIGYLALPFDAFGDFYKANIMNFSFAGAFNSRVNYLLRETKGWTYGTRGSFSGTKYKGAYTISGGFKSNATDSTIREIMQQLISYTGKEPITEAELTFTKNAMTQSDALKYEAPYQKLGFIKRVLDYDLPKNYVSKQTDILNGITKEEVNKIARRYLPLQNMAIVVVGDKAANFEKVKNVGNEFNFEVLEIDLNGNVVKE